MNMFKRGSRVWKYPNIHNKNLNMFMNCSWTSWIMHEQLMNWGPPCGAHFFAVSSANFFLLCVLPKRRKMGSYLRVLPDFLTLHSFTVLRTEMTGLESQEEDGCPQIRFFKPMSWLGQIRPHRRDETWSGSLWQTFIYGLPDPSDYGETTRGLWLQEISDRPPSWPP